VQCGGGEKVGMRGVDISPFDNGERG